MHRFVLKNKSIRNKNIIFNSEQSIKIRKVLRMKVGDIVEVIDNNGWIYTVKLTKLTNNESVGIIVSQNLQEYKKTNINIFQAFPKHIKVKFIIQKCTELGADRIFFFQSDFSQVKVNKISHDRLVRWRKIAEQSAEQSKRLFVPEIEIVYDNLKNILQNIDLDKTIFLDQNGHKLNELNIGDPNNINIFVGPEGGFSNNEIKFFERMNVNKVKVSQNILRTETAAIAFLSQLFLFAS